MDNNLRVASLTLVVATAAIVGGCSSEQYSRMCRTTESPHAQVFLCQQYYASDEGQMHLKQRKKEERERANVFDNCMIDAKSGKTNRTKTDCVEFANELIPQGSY